MSKTTSAEFAKFEADSAKDQALNRALRDLAKLRAQREEYAKAVYRAARDGISALKLAPVRSPQRDKRRSAEVAVPMLGDLQLGKMTPNYNSEVCEERIERYADKVLQLTDIQRADHPVKEAHVWMLGDIIEGVCLFPGQQFLVDASLYRQITLDGPRIVGNFLRRLLGYFDRVHVTAIIGNHGRIGKWGQYDPETNGDRMLYTITRQLLEHEKRLTWAIPEGKGERHWYAIDRIGKYSCLLLHGDQFGGRLQGSLTRLGVQRKVGGWKSGAIPEQFKDVAFGHWHINFEDTISDCNVRCNGSPESYNTFAQEALASMCRPSQRLMFVHPELGIVTAEYKCWLS